MPSEKAKMRRPDAMPHLRQARNFMHLPHHLPTKNCANFSSVSLWQTSDARGKNDAQ